MHSRRSAWISLHPSKERHSPESTPVEDDPSEVVEVVLVDVDPSLEVEVSSAPDVDVVHPTVTPSGDVVEEEEDPSESESIPGSSMGWGRQARRTRGRRSTCLMVV